MFELSVNESNIFKRQFFNFIDANKLNKKSKKDKVAHLKSSLKKKFENLKIQAWMKRHIQFLKHSILKVKLLKTTVKMYL